MNDDVTPRCTAPSAALRAQALSLSHAEALHAVADEIAGFVPVADTFKGMSGEQGAKVTLRMVVELLRERADNRPDTTRPATDAELNQPRGLSAAETPNSVEGVNND